MSLFLKALAGSNQGPRPPVWIMRQAGRYAPSYQAIKKTHTLNQMFRSADLIEEITKLPLADLGVDAAIIFADILHIPLTMGFDVNFPQGGGIEIAPLIETLTDFKTIYPVLDPKERLDFVFEGIRRVKKSIKEPLIGFAGGPFTVASYLFKHRDIKKWMAIAPEKVHALLEVISQQTVSYIQEQIKAGVDAIQIFESWASLLTLEEFHTFAMPYLKPIFAAATVPILFFSRASHQFLDAVLELEPSGISFDEFLPMSELIKRVPNHIAIQGNFNPYLLYSSKEKIQKEVEKVLAAMQGCPRYIVNLGHGIMRDVPFENAQYFVKLIKDSALTSKL